MVALEHPGTGQVRGEVQPGLSAQRREQRVWPLSGDDPLDRLDSQRLEIDAVGYLFVGHDRGRVRVDQNRLDAFLAQRLARLRARVVELSGLADDDRAGPEDEDLARPLDV